MDWMQQTWTVKFDQVLMVPLEKIPENRMYELLALLVDEQSAPDRIASTDEFLYLGYRRRKRSRYPYVGSIRSSRFKTRLRDRLGVTPVAEFVKKGRAK